MSRARRKKTFVHYFPVYGCVSTGLIYTGIGVIALLSFFKLRDGGADESSMLALINDFLVGKAIIAAILAGTVCYILWRFYEAVTDPYGYGAENIGIIKRTGICISTVADILIAYTALRVLIFGRGHIMLNGEPRAEQETVAAVLQQPSGNIIIMVVGILVIATAALQFWYGITKGYKERIDIDQFPRWVEHVTHVLAWVGYAARGIILGIIGFFLLKAGITENETLVVNTDKAFDFIGDNIGHLYFIIVAMGTICYGMFMFILGVAYDVDKN